MLSSLFLTCFCCHLHQKSQTSPTEASFPNLTCSVIWNVPVRLSCWRSKLIFYLFCSVQGSRLNFCNQWLSKCYLVENNTVISLLIGTSRPNPLKYRHRRGYSSVMSLHWTLLGALLTLLVTGTLCQSKKTLPIIENWLYDEIISWNYISVCWKATLLAVFLSLVRFWRTREWLHESSKIFVERVLGLIAMCLVQRAHLWPSVYQWMNARTRDREQLN